jgi:hypothetical protein
MGEGCSNTQNSISYKIIKKVANLILRPFLFVLGQMQKKEGCAAAVATWHVQYFHVPAQAIARYEKVLNPNQFSTFLAENGVIS